MTTYQKAIADAHFALSQHSRRNNKAPRLLECLDSIRAEAAKLGDEHPKIAKVKECEASLLVALGLNDDAIAVFNDLLAKLPRKPRRKRLRAAKKKLVYLARLLNIFEAILRAGERNQRAVVKQQLLGVVQANLPVVSKSLEEMRLRVGFMKLGMGRDHTINFLDAQAKGPFGDEAAMEALKLAIEQFISDPHGSLYESIAGRLNRKRQAKWWSLRAKPLSEIWLLGNAILHAYFTRETAKGLRPADLRTRTMVQATQSYIANAGIFGRPRLSRLLPLIGEETIWSDVYDGAEETKRLITDALFKAAFTKGRAQDAEVTEDLRLKIARCATCLQGFWQQADLREDLLVRLEEAWSGIDTPRAFVVRGQIAVVRNEHDRAEQLFMTAEERDIKQSLTGSGHSTFISPDRVKLRDFGIDDSQFSADACKFELKFADEPEGDGPVAVTSADPIYFRRYAVPYATSLWALAPRMPIHFHVLGDLGNVENTLVALGEAGGAFSISTETPAVSKPYYYATARFLRAAEFMRLFNRPLILTDIDVVFRDDPARYLPRWMEAGDAGVRFFDAVRARWSVSRKRLLYRYPKFEPWRMLNAGCVYLEANAQAKSFLDVLGNHTAEAMARFADNRGSNWWIDQNILYAVFVATMRQGSARVFSLENTGIPFGGYVPVEGDLGRPTGTHPALALLQA